MGGNQEEPQAQRHEDSYLPKHHPRQLMHWGMQTVAIGMIIDDPTHHQVGPTR